MWRLRECFVHGQKLSPKVGSSRVLRLALVVMGFTLIGFPLLHGAVTGELRGTVTDSDSAVVPGVTVMVTSPQLQGNRTAVTGPSGEYRLPLLPPGTYRVEFSLDGMESVVQSNVTITSDQTTKINATMLVGELTEDLSVIADSVVIDPTQATTQMTFKEDHLTNAIGSSGRNWLKVIASAPGVVPRVPAWNPNSRVMGANTAQNSFAVDGSTVTSGSAHGVGPPILSDAIKEISIPMLGRDAEYGRSIGGVVNVVTKSGGNFYSGSFDFRHENESFYESGDNFDPDERPTQRTNPSATLGGPLATDRLWFFVAAATPYEEISSPTLFDFRPATFKSRFQQFLGKVTASPAANHSVALRVDDITLDFKNRLPSPYVRPDAQVRQHDDGRLWNLGYDAILRDNWLASAQLGYSRWAVDLAPMGGDLTAIGTVDATTGVSSGNLAEWLQSVEGRKELNASTTYLYRRFGSHTFKAGVTVDRSDWSWYSAVTGTAVAQQFCLPEYAQPADAQCGAYYQAAGGSPSGLFVVTNTPRETYQKDLRAVFIQDEWHPITRVTLRLGVRHDAVEFHVPHRTDAPKMSSVQPRVGLAWDVRDDARSVIHAFWGRMMDDSSLFLARYGTTQQKVTSRFEWNGATQSYRYVGPISTTSVRGWDPNLAPTTSTEQSIGYTQKVWRNSSVDVTAVRRESHDIFEDSCVYGPCAFTNRPAGSSHWLRGKYEGVVARAELRPYSWIQGVLSYTWAKSQGSTETAFWNANQGPDFDLYPWHFVNTYGYLPDDARHRVKANGWIQVPWNVTVSTSYVWSSGRAWAPVVNLGNKVYGTMLLEPRGSRRYPDLEELDLQFLKTFSLGRMDAGHIVAVLNVLNSQTVTSYHEGIGPYLSCRDTDTECFANPVHEALPDEPARLRVTANVGQPTEWQRPRSYEVEFRLQF